MYTCTYPHNSPHISTSFYAVQKVRPSDVKVVAAIGDSITVSSNYSYDCFITRAVSFLNLSLTRFIGCLWSRSQKRVRALHRIPWGFLVCGWAGVVQLEGYCAKYVDFGYHRVLFLCKKFEMIIFYPLGRETHRATEEEMVST